jgi:hypothetical protein
VHAEVKALQQQHGLSYKEATHRLYHCEVKKLVEQYEIGREIKDLSRNTAEEQYLEVENKIRAADMKDLDP